MTSAKTNNLSIKFINYTFIFAAIALCIMGSSNILLNITVISFFSFSFVLVFLVFAIIKLINKKKKSAIFYFIVALGFSVYWYISIGLLMLIFGGHSVGEW